MNGLDFPRLTDDAERDGIDELLIGAIVHHQGRVLLLRRSPDDTFLPGREGLPAGGVENGEDLPAALARELAEEIGWTGPLTLNPGFVTHFDYTTGSGLKARQYTFAMAHDGSPVTLGPEHTAHRWIPPAEADTSDLTEESIQTIRDWAAYLAKTSTT